MSEFFLNIVNMSISASWIVLAVLLLRLLLKKAPKWITVLLWGIVAIRLICPFSIESVMSLIPSAETISPEIMMDRNPEINSGVPIINNVVNPIISESFTPDPATSANPLQLWIPTFAVIWLVGIIGLVLYTIISYVRVKRKVGTAILLRDNIFQSENVISPFVLGIIKPKIYLPFNMNEQDMKHVIAHEQAHINRKDHWWKPLGFLVLTVHWFNPLMWFGYVLLCRDIELACDEKVIKELNTEQKADYSQALLTCSVNRRMIAACPLAFGEVGVKDRVKSILNYKKPAFWIIIVAVVASVVVAVCFLTNPINTSDKVLNKLINLEDYEVVEQNEKNITLSIPVSKLSDSIYTESGKKFGEKEIIAYQDETTSIYLKEARYSNEGKDNLYFCFDFTFELPKKQGVLLYPYEITNSGLSGSVRTVDGILRADNGEFADAIANRGQGGNNLIWFYVSTDVLKQAQGTIHFDIELNQIAYWLDGDDSSISNVGGVDDPSEVKTTIDGYPFFFAEVIEIYDNSILVKATKDTELIKAGLEYFVSTNMINDSISLPEFENGTKIAIVFNGEIQETSPAQINSVYAIYNTTEHGEAISAPVVTYPDDNLVTAISGVLNDKYRAEKPDGLLHIENYYLLANETASGTPLKGNSGHMKEETVYLLVYHMKYSVNGRQLEEVEGGFVPTAISFKIDENGQYTLKEYWTPRSDANYEKDVLEKFPGASATDVLKTEQYAEDLIKENWRLATEYMHKINGTSSTLG